MADNDKETAVEELAVPAEAKEAEPPPLPSSIQQPQSPKEEDNNASKILLKGLEGLTIEGLQLFKKRTVEDNRMDAIFRSKENLQEKFDNRAYLHPHGMTDFDYKSIPEARREGFEKFKYKTRHENYKYLGEHYDLDSMLGLFFKKLLAAKPQDPVYFAADYFTTDILMPGYEAMLESEKRKISNYRVAKMKAAEKITTTMLHELNKPEKEDVKRLERCSKKSNAKKCKSKSGRDQLSSRESGEKPQDDNLNWLKKLNIGPLALDFDTRVILPNEEEIVEEVKEPEVPKPVKKFYCGCKDPGRRERNHPKIVPILPSDNEEEEEDEDEEDDDSDSDDLDPEESIASIASVISAPPDVGKKESLPSTEEAEVELPPPPGPEDVPVEDKTKPLYE